MQRRIYKTDDIGKDAAILFKRAYLAENKKDTDRAIELLNKTIALCEKELRANCVTRVAAHTLLYKLYYASGRNDEALEHFKKAVALGANAERLRAS